MKKSTPNTSYTYVTRPKAFRANSSKIRNILRSGNVEKVEKLIREGYGYKLIGETSPFPKIKTLLKAIPFYMARIDMLHEAVVKGQLRDVQMLLNTTSPACSVLKPKPENLAISKDSAGIGLLHKAVFYDHFEIIDWLAKNYPRTVHSKDKLGRIPLHYVNSTSQPDKIWDLLVSLESDINAEDFYGKTPLYYLTNETEIQLPDKPQNVHESHQWEENTIKLSNIRIWIHDQDCEKLQQVIWSGHGDKLKNETSNKPLVKKLLNGVPHIMSVIQEIHKATITNEINKLKLNSRNPIPPVILSSKDANGVTPLHKAVGLGHDAIVDYILSKYPEAIHIHDNNGRVALHYAASFKKDEIYDKLIKHGANENIIDKLGRTAKYYQLKQGEIDTNLLYEIPSAPRIGVANGYPLSWDWSTLNVTNSFNDLNHKIISTKSNKIFNKNKPISDNIQYDNEEERYKKNSHDSPITENVPSNLSKDICKISNVFESSITSENENKSYTEPESYDHYEEITEFIQEFSNDNENEEGSTEYSPIIEDELSRSTEDDHLKNNPITLHEEPKDIINNKENAIEEDFIDETKLRNKSNKRHKIKEILHQKNMDEISNFILQGYGELLLNEKSSHSEIQNFINNLPIYLKKIELIHHCCEIGNLEELQKYLDRRKLVIARENKTGLHLTPLHIAVIKNHNDIARYLGGRFPETFKVVDKFDRTPLHFASIHPKGSYIYNMLLTLGADNHVKDCNGKTPEYYYHNKNDKRYAQLLDVFEKSKKCDTNHTNENKINNVFLKSEAHGKDIDTFQLPRDELLSEGLGKAIRTGLSAIVNERPSKPIKYLADYLNNYEEISKPIENPSTSQQNFIELPRDDFNHEELKADERVETATSIKDHPTTEQENEREVSHGERRESTIIHSEHEEESSENEIKKFRNEGNAIVDYQEVDNQFHPISRDKHGQGMIHSAANSKHSRNALLQKLQELNANIAYRDELYRTARDIAVFAELYDNVKAIDTYVLYLAANGQTDKILQLLLDGYDHILELETEENIIDVVKNRNHEKTLRILQTIRIFEEIREELHAAIRIGNKIKVQEIFHKCGRDAKLMAICKNDVSRCSLHLSVLTQHKDIVKYIAKKYPETIHVGDNLERTSLHYAMGLKSVEEMSRILIEAGATRMMRDLKGRQPSYYFMNNAEILQIQKEEMFFRHQLNRKNYVKNSN